MGSRVDPVFGDFIFSDPVPTKPKTETPNPKTEMQIPRTYTNYTLGKCTYCKKVGLVAEDDDDDEDLSMHESVQLLHCEFCKDVFCFPCLEQHCLVPNCAKRKLRRASAYVAEVMTKEESKQNNFF